MKEGSVMMEYQEKERVARYENTDDVLDNEYAWAWRDTISGFLKGFAIYSIVIFLCGKFIPVVDDIITKIYMLILKPIVFLGNYLHIVLPLMFIISVLHVFRKPKLQVESLTEHIARKERVTKQHAIRGATYGILLAQFIHDMYNTPYLAYMIEAGHQWLPFLTKYKWGILAFFVLWIVVDLFKKPKVIYRSDIQEAKIRKKAATK